MAETGEPDDGYTRGVWAFNIERLRLTVLSANDRHGFDYIELVPLNVWKYGKDGVFERSRVVAQVDDWAERLDRLYKEIEGWAAKQGFRSERSRKVTMSEELMQHFSIPDRELAVLDILKADEPIISFVPRGLWIIGANGRVDVITRSGAKILLNKGEGGASNWVKAIGDALSRSMKITLQNSPGSDEQYHGNEARI